MAEPTLQELKEKLHQANEDYHEAVGEILESEHIEVVHKAKVGVKADMIFSLMAELNALLGSL